MLIMQNTSVLVVVRHVVLDDARRHVGCQARTLFLDRLSVLIRLVIKVINVMKVIKPTETGKGTNPALAVNAYLPFNHHQRFPPSLKLAA